MGEYLFMRENVLHFLSLLIFMNRSLTCYSCLYIFFYIMIRRVMKRKNHEIMRDSENLILIIYIYA